MSPPLILVDTDPGTDDVFALLWLCAIAKQGGCEIAAVTTCGGNVKESQTFINACRALSLFGFPNIPVGKGEAFERGSAAEFHGADGLGGTSALLSPSARELEAAQDSVDLIVETLESSAPQTVTVIGIGPCTNLERAELKSPGILKKAQQIVLMGAAVDVGGNITSLAEFNVWYNPGSFDTVLKSRNDVMVLPLDVTTGTLFSHAHLDNVKRHAERYLQTLQRNATERTRKSSSISQVALAEVGSEVELPGAPKTKQLIDFISAVLDVQVRSSLRYNQAAGFPGMPMHDGATIIGLFYPETVEFMRGHLAVETNLDCTSRGLTSVDRRHTSLRPLANSYIAKKIDNVAALSYCVEDIKKYVESLISSEVAV